MRLTRSGPSRRAANRSGVQHPTANCGNSVFIASLHQLVSCIVTHHTHHTTQLKQPGTQQLYNPLPRTGHHQHQWLSEPRLLAQPLALRSLRPGLGRLAPAFEANSEVSEGSEVFGSPKHASCQAHRAHRHQIPNHHQVTKITKSLQLKSESLNRKSQHKPHPPLQVPLTAPP